MTQGPEPRRIVMEISFANRNRKKVFPAMHEGMPLDEQLEALKAFLLRAMSSEQSFAVDLTAAGGESRVEILNQGNINAIDVFLEAPGTSWDGPPGGESGGHEGSGDGT